MKRLVLPTIFVAIALCAQAGNPVQEGQQWAIDRYEAGLAGIKEPDIVAFIAWVMSSRAIEVSKQYKSESERQAFLNSSAEKMGELIRTRSNFSPSEMAGESGSELRSAACSTQCAG